VIGIGYKCVVNVQVHVKNVVSERGFTSK